MLPKREKGAREMSLQGPAGHSAKSSFDTDERFYFSSRFKVILRLLDRQLDGGWHSLWRGGEPPSPPSLRSFTFQSRPLQKVLKKLLSRQSGLKPERTFPRCWRSFLIGGRFVTIESITRKQIGLIAAFHRCFLLNNILDSLSLELDCCEKETYK